VTSDFGGIERGFLVDPGELFSNFCGDEENVFLLDPGEPTSDFNLSFPFSLSPILDWLERLDFVNELEEFA